MAGPWEKYAPQQAQPPQQTQAPQSGPWARYAAQPGATPPAPAPEEGGFGDTILDVLGSSADGVRQGAANVIGFLPDLGLHAINNSPRLANLIPGVDGVGPITDDPQTVTDSLDSLLRGFGAIDDYQPETRAGKFANRVAEEAGAAVVPGGMIVQQANRMGKPAINAMKSFNWKEPASYLQGIAKSFLRPAAANNGRFMLQETGIGLGAGAGAATVNALTGNEDRENPYIDAAGAVGGAGITGIASAIIPRIGDILAAASGSNRYASGYVKEGVAGTLAANSDAVASQITPDNIYRAPDTDPLTARLRTTLPVNDAVPNYKPTTAEAAGDAGLLNLENSRAGQNNSGLFRTRRSQNTEAVEDALLPSTATEPSSRLTQELGLERDYRLNEADLLAVIAGDEADNLARPLTAQTTRSERGGAIREGIEGQRDVARERTSAAYEASGAGAVPADPAAVRETIDQAVAGLSEVRQGLLPQGTIDRVRRLGAGGEEAVPTGLLDAAGNPMTRPAAPPEPIPMDEVIDLRSELKRLQTAALADPRAENGGRNASEAIGRVVRALDGYIDDTLPPDQRGLLDEARAAKFDEAEAFGRQGDPLAAATARYPGGVPRMRDDRVASTFTDPQNIDRLFAQAPTNEVRKAVKEEILSRGDFNTAAGAARFREEYGEQLKRFPGLAGEIDAAVAARTSAESAREGATTLAKEIGEEGSGTVAKYLRYGDERAERAMARVVDGANPARDMDEILSFVGDDPKAVQGARKAFWEVMETRSRSQNMALASDNGTMPWDTGKWKRFMEDPGVQAAAERLYRDNPEHWNSVKTIQQTLQELGQTRAASRLSNPSGTFTNQKGAAVSLAETQAKFYEVARGRVNPVYMVTYLGTRIANRAVGKQSEKAFQRLLDEALLDPEVAARLVAEYNPANREALRRTTKLWAGNNAANFIDNIMDEDEDPVLEAVQE